MRDAEPRPLEAPNIGLPDQGTIGLIARREARMKFSISTFVNDDSIDPVSLVRAVEERASSPS